LRGSSHLQRIGQSWRFHLGRFAVFLASIEKSHMIEARRRLSRRLNQPLHFRAL
jgi:hypothetical protein